MPGKWDTPPEAAELNGADIWAAPPTAEELGGAPPKQQPQPQNGAPGAIKTAAQHYVEGATAGFSAELAGAAKMLGIDPESLAKTLKYGVMAIPAAGVTAGTQVLKKVLASGMPTLDEYRAGKAEHQAELDAGRVAYPKTSIASEMAGAVASSAAVPVGGAAGGVARAAKVGAGYGAVSGLGKSEADLTQGDIAGAAKDVAEGAVVGGVLGGAAHAAIGAVGSQAKKLLEAGRARLFKGAAGINKRAYVQMDAKNLLKKAGKYLDEMGIGWGDTTESIAEKLAARRDSLMGGLDEMVTSLDQMAAGKAKISADAVADMVEREVAAPLKKLAAARSEYNQVMSEAQAIREIGADMTFAEAAAQRRTMQQQINYDAANKRDIAADAKRKIADIWNKVIDKEAEPLLEKTGNAGGAYRELRHEFALVQEMFKHVENRVLGNKSVRTASLTDYGSAGIAGLMTGNPAVAIAGGIANHLARVYGNAAAGRAAIGMAKMAAKSPKALSVLLPPLARGATLAEEELTK